MTNENIPTSELALKQKTRNLANEMGIEKFLKDGWKNGRKDIFALDKLLKQIIKQFFYQAEKIILSCKKQLRRHWLISQVDCLPTHCLPCLSTHCLPCLPTHCLTCLPTYCLPCISTTRMFSEFCQFCFFCSFQLQTTAYLSIVLLGCVTASNLLSTTTH